MTEKDLHVRISVSEMKKLERYCKRTKRTKTDVIGELVRSLPKSGASNPLVGLEGSMDEGLLPGETPDIYKPRPDAERSGTARDL
uniref:CopG domain protein DNA-binding domain protein n=1 Tax=Gloeothece verrucosa (strain PCC 7822) TaxID=497965 RepID=E0UJK3_GLOV7|nr:hypothetical protein Cyan7822_0197 [Gloeothece verrucosa PCC 7822]